MEMNFEFGVSYNCVVGHGDKSHAIGGGEEGDMTTDFVGNDIHRIFAHINAKAIEGGETLTMFTTDHDLIDEDVQEITQGEVVAVIVEDHGTDDEHVVAVIFNRPQCPTVIE